MAARPNALELLVRAIDTHQQAAAACLQQSHAFTMRAREVNDQRKAKIVDTDDPADLADYVALMDDGRTLLQMAGLADLEAAVHTLGLTVAGAAFHLGEDPTDGELDLALERAGLAS